MRLSIKENTQVSKMCPECKNVKLIVKANKMNNSQFLGCPNFPKCRHTQEITEDIVRRIMENGKLQFIRAYEINCGLCVNGDYYAASDLTRKTAEQYFYHIGWSRTRSSGWLCPKCTSAQQSGGADGTSGDDNRETPAQAGVSGRSTP